VPQVNLKNSTSVGTPEARFTEAGSVATSLSPRDVATIIGAGAVAVSRRIGEAVSWDICTLVVASTFVSTTDNEPGEFSPAGAQPEMTIEMTMTIIGTNRRVIIPP
jgi:hypothetical protein